MPYARMIRFSHFQLKQQVHQVLTSQMARVKSEKGGHGDQETGAASVASY